MELDDDFALMLEDLGVPVTIGATTIVKGGILKDHSVDVLGERDGIAQHATDRSLLIRRGSFPELAEGVAVTVDGVTYTAGDFKDVGRSKSRIWLENA